MARHGRSGEERVAPSVEVSLTSKPSSPRILPETSQDTRVSVRLKAIVLSNIERSLNGEARHTIKAKVGVRETTYIW